MTQYGFPDGYPWLTLIMQINIRDFAINSGYRKCLSIGVTGLECDLAATAPNADKRIQLWCKMQRLAIQDATIETNAADMKGLMFLGLLCNT